MTVHIGGHSFLWKYVLCFFALHSSYPPCLVNSYIFHGTRYITWIVLQSIIIWEKKRVIYLFWILCVPFFPFLTPLLCAQLRLDCREVVPNTPCIDLKPFTSCHSIAKEVADNLVRDVGSIYYDLKPKKLPKSPPGLHPPQSFWR